MRKAFIAGFKASLLATAIIPVAVFAQEAPPVSVEEGAPSADDDAIIVTGIRGSLQASQNIKRNSDFGVDVITSEDIGKFPSRNVAEALQQIPGIAISNSGGEGQQVTVRGLGPEFNTVLLNGRRIATDASNRAFNFDSISSDMLGGTEVYKTINVALQDGGIGSTINLKTLRPLDMRDDTQFVVSARGVYDRETKHVSPEIFGFAAAKFADGRFGVLLGASYQERHNTNQWAGNGAWSPITISNTALFADGKGNGTGQYWRPATMSYIKVDEKRRRIGLNGALQAEISDTLLLTLDGMYSSFDVKGDGIEKAYYGNPSNIVPGTLVADENNVLTKYSFINGPEFVKQNYDRRSRTYAFGGNLKWTPSDRFTSILDVSKSIAKNNNGGNDMYFVIHGPDMIMTIDNTQGYDTPIGIDGRIVRYDPVIFPAGSPQLASAPPVGTDWNRNNLNGYRSWWTTRGGAQTKDTIFEARWDNDYEIDRGWFNRFRFGAGYAKQRKDLLAINSDAVGWDTYGAYGIPIPGSLLHTDNQRGFLNIANTPGLGQFINFDGEALIDYLLSPEALALRDQLHGFAPGTSAKQILPRGYDAVLDPGASYRVNEKNYSAYAELTLKGDVGSMPLTVVMGLRYSKTDEAAVSSQRKLLDIKSAPGSGGTQYVSVFDTAMTPTVQSSKYDNWLPSVNLKLGVTDDIIFRAAVGKSLSRPSMGQLNPVIVFPATLRPSGLTASGGNADLRPYVAWNYDASVEWYYAKSSYLSAAFFHKDISDYIVRSIVRTPITIANSEGLSDANISGTTASFDVSQFVNLTSAKVSGFELAAQTSFNFLPSFLQYTGVTASVTLPWTNREFDKTAFTGNTNSMPGLSNSYYASAYYDDGKLQARVSWSRREEYFAGFLTATEPLYTQGRSQWDARVSYDISPMFQVFADAYNITNSPIRQRSRYASEFVRFQETGARYDAGVRVKF